MNNNETSQGCVVIVDDNPNNLQVLSRILQQAGFKVRPALSGEIALRAIAASAPDLVLPDIRMPGMDGYETCRRLKAGHLSPIFDPSSNTKSIGKGAGLGLSLSCSIVNKHQGRIEVQSEDGKSSRFRVRLPITQPTEECVALGDGICLDE